MFGRHPIGAWLKPAPPRSPRYYDPPLWRLFSWLCRGASWLDDKEK